MSPVTQKPIAVITGAGSGIGATFARHLYQQNHALLLIDICADKLAATRESLLNSQPEGSRAGIDTLVADLTRRKDVEAVAARLGELKDVELLINNAGFGSLEDFSSVDVQRHADMIAIHVETPMRLIHAVLPQMKMKNRGSIINVASLGAFAPCAQAVLYASTKAGLVVFSEALQEELRDTHIRVQALCPGFVRTEFHYTSSMRNFHRRRIPASLWTTPDEVVTCSLRGLRGNRVVVIPGWRSRMLGLVMQMVLLKPIVRVATRPREAVSVHQADGALMANSPSV
jgi:uncharacterized protein